MTRVLVTGAAGFVGRHVVDAAARAGCEVLAVEHRWSSTADLPGPVDACIHLGWYADPADYLTAVGPNADSLVATLDLAAWLERIGCRSLVVAGSSAEYAPAERPVGEDDAVVPTTVYGAAKAMCHSLLVDRHGVAMRIAWARLFNVVGPGEHAGRVLPVVASALLDGKSVDLTEGTQVRDYIDVRDAAEALVALSRAESAGVFNVSRGVGVPLRDMLLEMAEVTGGQELLRFGARPTGAHENLYLVGRCEKLREATGFVASRDTASIAREVVGYWSETRAARA